MEGGLCAGLSDLDAPMTGIPGISPPPLEPEMPLEEQATKSGTKPRRRRRSIFGLRRKPGSLLRLPTDPIKRRFRVKNVFYVLVPMNSPGKQGEHESQKGGTSINAGTVQTLSQTEAQPSHGNLTSPMVAARSSRVIKIPKRFLDGEDEKISWPRCSSVESSKFSHGSALSPGCALSHGSALSHGYSYNDPGGKRQTKLEIGTSTRRDKYYNKKMMRAKLWRMEELNSPGVVKKPTVLVSGANVTATGTLSSENREALNYAVNIKREDGGSEWMLDVPSNIKREDGCGGEGMVMLDAGHIKREDGVGGEEMVLDAKNIKQEYEGGGEEMVVDPANMKGENWGIDEEIVVRVDAENIKQESEEEESEDDEAEEEYEHCDEGMVVVDAENIKREDGAVGQETVMEQGDISHRVNLSNKRMLHMLKRAKVQFIKIDQQKRLKSSQKTLYRQNLCIDRRYICKDCSMVFHGPAQLHNHRLSLHPQTKWTAS